MTSDYDQTATLPLGLWASLRWLIASYLLFASGAVAPKEADFLDPLKQAARYITYRVKGRISNVH